MAGSFDPRPLVGRSPDDLTLSQRARYRGVWIALELYSPQTTPLRRIVAAAPTPGDCTEALAAAGLDPSRHELVLLR